MRAFVTAPKAELPTETVPGPIDLRNHRFTLLLGSLVLLLLLSPLLEGNATGNLVLTGLFTVVMLAAVFAASGGGRTLAVALVLALPWVYLTWVHPLWRTDATDSTSVRTSCSSRKLSGTHVKLTGADVPARTP